MNPGQKLLQSINFTLKENQKILSLIKRGVKRDKIAAKLGRPLIEIDNHISTKPSLRIASRTGAQDREIARMTEEAWAIPNHPGDYFKTYQEFRI